MGRVVCWREDMTMFFFVCIDLGGWKTILYHIKRRKEGRGEEKPKCRPDIPYHGLAPGVGGHIGWRLRLESNTTIPGDEKESKQEAQSQFMIFSFPRH